MLGAEKEIIRSYVETGQVQMLFWPMLDHGNASLNASAAAYCIGQESADAYWQAHDLMFERQAALYGADQAWFESLAAEVGVDPAAFATCYSGGAGHGVSAALDSARRDQGIFRRPTFDIEGQFVFGSQPFGAFAAVIDGLLAGGN